ncbi:N-acetyltransferase [Pseudomarimonas arenosa]|uniref:GNAT family N-acetyltransferase n=1 Tax=Pseudomarimonas arenosa TaxID=2774145 RepID=UPI002FC2A45F
MQIRSFGFDVREEEPGDLDAIEAVIVSAFLSAPRSSRTEHIIVRALRSSRQLAVSLIATFREEVLGHVAASPVSLSSGQSGWYGLGPVSVTPAHQGRGVGQCLIKGTLSRLRALGAQGCVVLGSAGYYSRFGFTSIPSLVLPGATPEHFQAISFACLPPTAVVSYHESFVAHG